MKQKLLTKDTFLILLGTFFYMASPMMVTPLITGYAETLGAGGTLMGFVGASMNFCALVLRPYLGNLADRKSKYFVAFLGTGLVTLATAGYLISRSVVVLVIARVVCGFGYACCSVCMATWMSNLLPRDRIGAGMGLFGAINAISMAIAPAVSISINERWGYLPAFAVALAVAAGGVIVIQFVEDKGLPLLKEEELKKAPRQIVDINVVPIAIIIMLFTMPYCATQSFLVRYMAERQPGLAVSAFFPVYAITLLTLRLLLKEYFDKVPFGRFLAIGCTCAFCFMLLMTTVQNNVMMFAAAMILSGGYGLMYSVCQSTSMLLAGPEKRGLANSTYYIGMDIGMAGGPLVGGMIYEHLSFDWFYPIFMITIPLAILTYVTMLHKKMKNGI